MSLQSKKHHLKIIFKLSTHLIGLEDPLNNRKIQRKNKKQINKNKNTKKQKESKLFQLTIFYSNSYYD